MTDSGRPTPAQQRHVVVAEPRLAKTNRLVTAIVGGVVLMVGLVFSTIPATGVGGSVLRVIGLILIVSGAAGLIIPFLMRNEGFVRQLTGWSNPRLEITPWPLLLGSTATVVYRRKPARANTINSLAGAPEVKVELVCQELVVYTVGTDTKTETSEVVNLVATAPARMTGDGLEAVFHFVIPLDHGAPTLTFDHNRISWWLDSRLGEPFSWRTSTRLDLVVPAIMDRRALVEEGGSESGPLR